MSRRRIGNIWERGLGVLNSVRDSVTGSILLMLGDEVGETSESANAESWQESGFASRPSKPTAGQPSAQVVVLRGPDRDVAIASRDTRYQSIYGSLDHGETCVYATGPDGTSQGRILIKADGSINLYTKAGNTSGGNGMVIQVDAANNAIRLLNGLGYGIIIDADGVRLTAGGTNAGLTIGSDGTATLVSTGQTQVDGATILLGSTAVPVANAALKGPTGISGSPSLKTIIE